MKSVLTPIFVIEWIHVNDIVISIKKKTGEKMPSVNFIFNIYFLRFVSSLVSEKHS